MILLYTERVDEGLGPHDLIKNFHLLVPGQFLTTPWRALPGGGEFRIVVRMDSIARNIDSVIVQGQGQDEHKLLCQEAQELIWACPCWAMKDFDLIDWIDFDPAPDDEVRKRPTWATAGAVVVLT
jgi:hypothetical protein